MKPPAAALALSAVLLTGPAGAADRLPAEEKARGTTVESGTACYKSGEQRSGSNRICYYRCPTGTAAITVSIVQPCPVAIRR